MWPRSRHAAAVDSSPAGLSEKQARTRLARDGLSRLPPPEHRSALGEVSLVVLQAMVLQVLACTLLFALLGRSFGSAVLLLSIGAVAAILMYQEFRNQREL